MQKHKLCFLFIFLFFSGINYFPLVAEEETETVLAKAQKAYQQRGYKKAIKILQTIKTENIYPVTIRDSALFLEASCYHSLNNPHQTVQLLENQIDSFKNEKLKIDGHLLLAQAHKKYGGSMSSRLLRHYEIPFQYFNTAFKKDGSKKKELLEILFLAQDALAKYWNYYAEQQKWRAAFNQLSKEKKDWRKFVAQKREELNSKRIEKLINIYNYIEEVAGKDSHDAARANFFKACFYVNTALDTYSRVRYYTPAQLSQQLQDVIDKGIEAFRVIPKSDELADDAHYLAAFTIHHKKNDLVEAVKSYRKFIREFPNSKWSSDARSHLQKIFDEEIQLKVPRVFNSKETIKLNLKARNVENLNYQLRKVDLLEYPYKNYNYDAGAKQQAKVQKNKGLAPLKQWNVKTGIKKDHIGIGKETEIPNLGPGAYVLTATGRTKETQVLILVSDIVLVTREAREKLLTYVVDSVSGKPVPNAQVASMVSVSYNRGGTKRERFVGQTDANGLFVADLSKYGHYYYYYSETVAEHQENVGVTSQNLYQQNRQDKAQVLGYTNQPVYRPGQKVEFKMIFRTRKAGKLQNLKNKMLTLFIQDPTGNKVYNETLYTNEYGSISDTFQIKEKKDKPTLGIYQMVAQIDGRAVYQENYRYPNFRVEEYKKPEFKVSVIASSKPASFNEEVKATIHGEYYFGGPVAGGTVSYTIYATPHYTSYSPYQKYNWYGGNNYRGYRSRHHRPYYGRKHVASIQNQSLDASGNFEIKFNPKILFAHSKQQIDHLYQIEAQVVDKSRRMIKGQGSIYVTHKDFSTFLNPKKYLYLKGESAQIEIVTKTANGSPVACKGEVLVELQDTPNTEKATYKEVLRDSFSIDATGKGLYSMIPDEEGYFRVTFKTQDSKKREILSSCWVWVVSESFRGDKSRFSDITLVADKKSYQIGETAQVLLTSHLPGTYALVSVIGGQNLLNQQVVHLAGKSALFSVNLTEAHTPNAFVHCLIVKGNKIYQSSLPLAVPPLQCFSTIEIKSDKETYLPGQKAKLEITTKDYLGQPVAMEVSLGAVDESLFYINPDNTPDIRKFFYGRARQNQVGFRSSLQFSYSGSGTFLRGYSSRRFSTHNLPQSYQKRFHDLNFLLGENGQGPGGGGRHRTGHMEMEKSEEASGAFSSDNLTDSAAAPSPSKKSKDGNARGRRQKKKPQEQQGGAAAGPKFKEAKVRTNFKDNCFWAAHLLTSRNGKATVEITLPDNLTTWTLTSRGIDLKNRVGVVQKSMVTQKEIIIRPQQPRFFRERDLVTVSAIVQNNLNETLSAKVVLDIDEKLLSLVGMPENEKERTIRIRGKKDYRVDWVVSVRGEGETKIKMSALTIEDSDAVEQSFPVYLHGIEKYIAQNGVMIGEKNQLAGDDSHTLLVDVPNERIPESTRLALTISPTTASVVLEALPYLAQFPYGCVEQTMSRFLPSVLTAKTLTQLGISFNELMTQHQQKLARGDYKGKGLAPLACLSDEVLSRMIDQGKQRLYSFQHSDGGWGWWKNDSSNPYMTSYVLFGFLQAKKAGVAIDSSRIQRGANFLLGQLKNMNLKEDLEIGNNINANRIAYMLYSLSSFSGLSKSLLKEKKEQKIGVGYTGILQFLYQQRDLLNAYGLSLLALTHHNLGKTEEAKNLLTQILDHATVEADNDTISFGQYGGYYYWYQNGIEATSFALKALVAIDPTHASLPKIAKWLVLKRSGTRWKSTKDTAIAIYGLLDYLKLTGELNPNYSLVIKFGNKEVRRLQVTKDNIFSLENEIVFEANTITAGSHTFRIEKQGAGNLYYSLALSYFTLEEDITAVKTEIGITRNYYKVEINEGKETRTPIAAGVTLKSGDLIDVELIVKNIQDCEYLIIEDFKPAGCEPLELTSGGGGGSYLSHREMRDELVAFFISFLPKGTHTYSYRTRAEIPGSFHTMPAMVQAMYAPHLRANSQEWRVKIIDE